MRSPAHRASISLVLLQWPKREALRRPNVWARHVRHQLRDRLRWNNSSVFPLFNREPTRKPKLTQHGEAVPV